MFKDLNTNQGLKPWRVESCFLFYCHSFNIYWGF